MTDLRTLTQKSIVSIDFHGKHRAITTVDRIDMPITDRTRVTDVLEYVRVQYPALHLDEGSILVTVNHEVAPLHQALRHKDTVSFLPHIGGG